MDTSLTPFISIVIPTYNRADLIPIAIQSVLDQTYQNWELIIVDNFSDDDTKEVVESFADHRISMLQLPRTGSVAASRNFGVLHSKGEWIAFLDSDDWWFPEKLSMVFKAIQSQPDLIYHDLQIVSGEDDEKSKKKTKSRKLKSPIFFDLLQNGNDIALSSVTLRKSTFAKVGGMNESPTFFAVEDYDTWLRIAQVTERFVHIHRVLGVYRLHDGNIGQINNFNYLSNAIKGHLKDLNNDQLRRYESFYTYQIARNKYNNKQYRESTKDLLFVLRFGRVNFVIKSAIMLLNNFILRGIIPK